MRRIIINIILVSFLLLAGCQEKPSDDELLFSYVNTKHQYEVIFPEEWIGKVNLIHYGDSDIRFIYNQVTAIEVPVIGFSVLAINEWEAEKEESDCDCGTSEITRTDRYVYFKHIVLDMPISCPHDEEIIGNCEEKFDEAMGIIRAFDVSKHFRLLDSGT